MIIRILANNNATLRNTSAHYRSLHPFGVHITECIWFGLRPHQNQPTADFRYTLSLSANGGGQKLYLRKLQKKNKLKREKFYKNFIIEREII